MLIKFFILPLINISKNVYLHLMFFWMDFKQI